MSESEHMPDEARLRALLVGKKVVRAEIRDESPEPGSWGASGPTGFLTLSDGTRLKLWGNDGGCACSAGCYPLATLNDCDNIITNVEVGSLMILLVTLVALGAFWLGFYMGRVL